MRSHHWFLLIAVLALGYVFFRGGSDRYAQPAPSSQRGLNYNTVAVSQGMTPQARSLNLEQDLDVSLLPEIGKQAIRDAAQRGLKEQAFLEAVMRDVSNRISEISTIDLNADKNTDPILIKPEPAGNEGYVIFSIRVPAQNAYPLPPASDAAAWKNVETFEVATMTVALDEKALTVQAQGNQHVYPNSANQHYYAHDRHPSFLQTYLTIRMLEWMFFPPFYGFYGPGWGYGFHQPYGVGQQRFDRRGRIADRGYSSARSTNRSVVRGRSGRTPTSAYSRAYSRQAPRSLNRLRSTRSFSRRSGGTVGRGGFGSRYSGYRGSSRGFGGYGRGSSRGSFGGGGTRWGK